MNYKVLVSDPLAEEGIEILRGFCEVDVRTGLSEEQLIKIIGEYDGLLVRSGTQVTESVIEAAEKLRFVGRAGAGVDNINLDAATKKGIIVANAPAGNTLAACEHTLAMMASLARNIPQATASVKKGEWKRSAFMGVELNDKVLGIVGFGRIGQELAKRASALEMKVVAYDPYINRERAKELGVEVMTLDELFPVADFITVHTPLIKETKHLINTTTIATMKDGVRIINCARGGIINEADLCDAIAQGKVAGAALDVYEEEPPKASGIISLDQVICTPHLGASTVEAQLNVAVSVAKQCIEVLKGGSAKFVVNAPMIPPDQVERIEPYANLAQKMGKLLIQLVEGRIESVEVEYGGKTAEFGQNTKYITRLALKGMLDPILQTPVNIVNAELAAKERGIRVSETITEESFGFTNVITIRVKTDKMEESVSGNVSSPGKPRIVKIGEYMTDMTPTGHVVISRHHDVPGVIGKFATIIGHKNVNIAGMQVGRNRPGDEAIMVLNVDSEVPQDAMDEIVQIDGVFTAKYAKI
ncbi:phosphoglycerate dehydrogenase [Methanoplanus endosymbiosus]|uniref:D-3-phosphoglycerate dehydrogenase n=1 Tax=Methanoplanus endosymbiosus TaxID=33865 RepID=A0A9E7PP59_9EURY|nr:phosphoglycerate dehydrogenase [Methanoplanus endosymbiosus]UUX93860.1 phosphoglycerate dehydrogenase [Methanoplanus endosymbiosus]